jgi:hypothetical protein
LLIPGHNDSDDEIAAECEWLFAHLGPDVPLHFTAFHPDFKMRDVPPTPPATLTRARRIALDLGLRYVYTGNVHDPDGQTTTCPGCGEAVIVRDWYVIEAYALGGDGRCRRCRTPIPGRFAGPAGTWGPRRLPVRLAVAQQRAGPGHRNRRGGQQLQETGVPLRVDDSGQVGVDEAGANQPAAAGAEARPVLQPGQRAGETEHNGGEAPSGR